MSASKLFSLATESYTKSTGDLAVSLLDFTEATDEAISDAATVVDGSENLGVIQAGADSLAEAQEVIPENDETQAPAVLDAVAGPVEEAYRSMGWPQYVAGRTFASEDFKGGRQGKGRAMLGQAHESLTRDIKLGASKIAERALGLIKSGTAAFAHGHGTLKDCEAEIKSSASDANKAALLKLMAAAGKVLSVTETEFQKASKALKDMSVRDSSSETHKEITGKASMARNFLSLQRSIVSDAVRVAKKLGKSQEDHSAQLNQYVSEFNTLVGHIKSASTGEDVSSVISSLKSQTEAIAGKTFGSRVSGAVSATKNWVKGKFGKKDTEPAEQI